MKNTHAIVGVWFVKVANAPFPYHMFKFHADGTMSQANPDAGDPRTSDSDGMGLWQANGHHIKGKFVEITADRVTHTFVSRGEISFFITVEKDVFRGTWDAVFYDERGSVLQKLPTSAFEGKRIVLA